MTCDLLQKSCEVCCDSESKYRCPTCRITYCTVGCFKNHKEVGCKIQEIVESVTNDIPKVESSHFYPTEDTLSLEVLQRLGCSEELREMLNYLDLRQMILAVDKSKQPSELLSEAMRDPVFYSFVTKCLQVVNSDSVD